MKIPRQLLIILSILVSFIFVLFLVSSFQEQQVQSNLELSQSNLILQASQYKLEKLDSEQVVSLRRSLFGENIYETAQKQYKEAIKNSPKDAEKLYLNLGLLQAKEGKTTESLVNLNKVVENKKYAKLAEGLISLEAEKPVLEQLEVELKSHLKGWFRYYGLRQLYQQETRQEDLKILEVTEQKEALIALVKLLLISILPLGGILVGIIILILLLTQWSMIGKEAILSRANDLAWETPWTWETILQVFVVGFFLVSQGIVFLILPLVLKLFDTKALDSNLLFQAIKILITYTLMSAAGLGILYLSIKPFFPLPKDWFKLEWRGNWFLQGIGGYLVALPLVVLIALLNQQIWQGQGGSNPLLFLAIETQNGWVLLIFFITACLAAPFYEEILFRGFLLPSLTRYLPVWGAIILSGFLFALAHLNLSEVLPLTVLGIVLGFVYQRSRNLLSSMLLHSLWNTGTLLSLFLLGGGS